MTLLRLGQQLLSCLRSSGNRPAAIVAMRVAALGIAATAFSHPAAAQLPPSVNLPPLPPPGSPIPNIAPQAPPGVAPGPLLPPPSGPEAPVPAAPVAVSRVSVEGVTTFPQDEIARLADGLTGPAVSLAKIDEARQAILARYRAQGYVLTAVNAVLDAEHHLRFVVTEGRIAEVKLDGDIGPAGTQVLRFLSRLTEQTPIDAATLERYLLLAQDVPGVTLRAVLRPSTDEPGALTLIAQVSRQSVSGLFTSDNRAFNLTGPEEALGVVDFNSFTEYGERTEVSLYHTYNNTQTFGQAASDVFLGSSGLRLHIYAGDGDATPSGNLRTIGYFGTTTVFGSQLSYPLIRARQQTLTLFGTLDALDSAVDTNTGSNGSAIRASYDSLRVARIGTDYALSDLWLGDSRSAVNTATLRLSQGLSILGAAKNGDPLAARVGERIDFFKANFDLSRTQTLLQISDRTNVSLLGILAGQVSPDVLPPAEKFFLGGSRITRGFYAGQVTGDNALAATGEVQLNTDFNAAAFGYSAAIATQFYGFCDWGETWENLKQDQNERLLSTGGGVRMMVTQYTEFDVEGVARLTRYPNGSGPGVSPIKGDAVYWRVLVRF
jgi:hemolysin activation/secretion protein